MASIDTLTINITANANKAVKALDELCKALGRVNDALGKIDYAKLDGLTNATDSLNTATSELNKNSKAYSNVAKDISKASSKAGDVDKIKKSADGLKNSLNGVENEAKRVGNALKNVGDSVGGGNSSPFKKFSNTMKNIGKGVSNVNSFLGLLGKTTKGVFKVITAPATMAGKAIKKLGRDNSETAVTAKKLAKEFFRVGKMLKLMITRMVLRKIISGIGDGFKNLAQYSREVDASMSLLWNSFRQLGNSIASAVSPLLNAFAPALNYIIQLAIKAVNAINQLISALLGLGVWTKAKTLTDSYAKSLDKSNKSAKELKKTVLGFDELNQLQDNKNNGSGGTSPADMFEEAPIEEKWKNVADTIKKIWDKLITPIKKAWEDLGGIVKASWSRALKSIGSLVKTIGEDFLEVWNQEETVEIFRDMLRIIANIGDIVHFLASNFEKAWKKNKVGLRILEKIRDIYGIVVKSVERITQATVDWAKDLDFSPLLEGFDGWLESLKNPIKEVSKILEDFYIKVLLPLGKWSVEKGLPDLLNIFEDFNNKVKWDVIRERLEKLWDALAPFTKTVGEGLLKFIREASDSVAGFLNSEGWNSFIDTLVSWMANIDADDIANDLDKICKMLLAFEGLKVAFTAFDKAIAFMSAVKKYAPILKLAIIVTVAIEGLEAGKTIGSMIFPDDKELYDHYKGVTGSLEMLKDFAVGIYDGIVMYVENAFDRINAYAQLLLDLLGFVSGERTKIDLIKDWTTIQQLELASVDRSAYEENIRTLEDFKNKLDEVQKKHDEITITVEKEASALDKIGDSKAREAFEKMNSSAKDFKVSIGETSEGLKTYSTVSDDTKKKLDGLLKSTEGYTSYTPKLTKSQQDIIDSLGKVKVETENVSTETANAGLEISGAWQSCSYNTDKSAKDIEKSVTSSMDEVNKSMQSVKDGMSEDQWTFQGVIDGFRNTFKGVKDAIAPIWNSIANKLNGDHDIGGGKFPIHLPTFASGGFVEDGLFMANHGELVGRFSNGRTAVANNEQITEGIARAVFNAMTSANASGGNTRYINNTIMVDGVAIARAVTKGQETLDRRYSPTMA